MKYILISSVNIPKDFMTSGFGGMHGMGRGHGGLHGDEFTKPMINKRDQQTTAQ